MALLIGDGVKRRSRLICAISAGPLALTLQFFSPTFAAESEVPSIQLYGSPDESFESMVLKTVEDDPASQSEVEAVLRSLLQSAQAGEDLEIPHSETAAEGDAAQIDSTIEALKSAIRPARPAGTADPADYKRIGGPVGDRRAWELTQAVNGFRCNPRCSANDKLRVRFIVDPARFNDRIQYFASYTNKSSPPIFGDIYATVGNYTKRGVNLGDRRVGDSGSQDGNGSGSATLVHENAEGLAVQNLFRLHFVYRPADRTDYLRNRTGLADCKSGSNLNCIFRPATPID